MDSKTCLSGDFWDHGFFYLVALLLPTFFLRPTPRVLGALPYFFSVRTFCNGKKATNGNVLLDSLVANLDLRVS